MSNINIDPVVLTSMLKYLHTLSHGSKLQTHVIEVQYYSHQVSTCNEVERFLTHILSVGLGLSSQGVHAARHEYSTYIKLECTK